MFLVGVAGGSGSGKTTFAKKVLDRVQRPEIGLLNLDSYYMQAPPEHLMVNGKGNFDHPEAFDWELVREHLALLKTGSAVEVPVYDFNISRRTQQTSPLGPCQVLIVEGIFTLWDSAIRDLFDVKIFLHVEADIRFIRRLHRDVKERGRNIDGIIQQYYDTVRPMHNQFLEPTRGYADIVVGEETDIASEVVSAQVKEVLGTR